MAFLAAVIMIVAGLGVAAVVLAAIAIQHGERKRAGHVDIRARARDEISASILFQIARLGGSSTEEAFRVLRETGVSGRVTANADLGSWAREYTRRSSAAEQTWLLETAVRTAVASASTIPLAQYNALLDLSFSLGFQTDALARLRARYRFAYVDYAKHQRPRSADRMHRAALIVRSPPLDRRELMRVLELEPPVTRQRVISAYRRLAALSHPDRFHAVGGAEQQAAMERFIRLTEVYEQLLPLCEDD